MSYMQAKMRLQPLLLMADNRHPDHPDFSVDQVLEILNEFPNLSINNFHGSDGNEGTPLQIVFPCLRDRNNEDKLQIVKIFFDIVVHVWALPYTLSLETRGFLGNALRGELGIDAPLMDSIFDQLAASLQATGRKFHMTVSHCPIQLEQARALCKIMPFVSLLELEERPKLSEEGITINWTRDGMKELFGEIGNVTRLSLSMPPDLMQDPATGVAFQNALRLGGASLENATLHGSGHTSDDAFLGSFSAGMGSNRAIESLTLDCMDLSDPSSLSAFLSNCGSKRIKIEHCIVDGEWVPCDFKQTCNIKRINIEACDLSSPYFQGMLAQVLEIPKLRKLEVITSGYTDEPAQLLPLQDWQVPHDEGILQQQSFIGVDPEVEVLQLLLQKNPLIALNLTQIENERFSAIVQCVRAHMANNTSIKSLTLSVKGDLEMMVPDECRGDINKIHYCVALNQHGRGQVMGQMSLSDFVARLHYAPQMWPAPSNCCPSQLRNAVYDCRFNHWYGFLRTKPDVWCDQLLVHTHQDRGTKRKSKAN